MKAPSFPETPVKGAAYRGEHATSFVRDADYPIHLLLEREPENPHDPNAIRVLVDEEDGEEPWFLAHIAKETAAVLAYWMDKGIPYFFRGERWEQHGKGVWMIGTAIPVDEAQRDDAEADETAPVEAA